MAASPKLAGDHEKITSSVHVNMDGRTLWPKSIGAQGQGTHSQAVCSCMREANVGEWIFFCKNLFNLKYIMMQVVSSH